MSLRQFLYALIFGYLVLSGLAEAAVQESKPGANGAPTDSGSDFDQIFLDLKAASKPRIYHEGNSGNSSAESHPKMAAEQKIYSAKRTSPADPAFSEIFSTWRKHSALKGSASTRSASNRRNAAYSARGIPQISSDFGLRRDPMTHKSRLHKGLDIPGPLGAAIYATANGIVGEAKWLGSYGLFVEIDHANGVKTRYAHLSRIGVNAGQRVRRNDIIGYMGSTGRSTGNHLHYEVHIDGVAVDPKPLISAAN